MIMKRGQAAMEFLMTYGWALLIVLVAIGALAYLGVLNPTRFTPDQCTISPGFTCSTYQAKPDTAGSGATGFTAGDDVYFVLQNGLGQSLTTVTLSINNVTVGGNTVGACNTATPELATSWADGATQPFGINCDTSTNLAWSAGDKFKGQVLMTYTAGGIQHTKLGQMVMTIE